MRIRQLLGLFLLAFVFAGVPVYAQQSSDQVILDLTTDGDVSDADLVAIAMALAAEGNSPDQIATAMNNMPGVTVTPAQIATGMAATGISQAQVQASVQSATGISAAAAATAANAGFTNASNVAGATTLATGTGVGQTLTTAINTAITLTSGGAFVTTDGTPIIIRDAKDVAAAVVGYVYNLYQAGNSQLTDAQKNALTSIINSNSALQNGQLASNLNSGGDLALVINGAVYDAITAGSNVPPNLQTS